MTVIYMRKKAAILQKYIVLVYTVENDSYTCSEMFGSSLAETNFNIQLWGFLQAFWLWQVLRLVL